MTILAALGALAAAGAMAAPPTGVPLTAAEVKSQIVGHSVAHGMPGGMTFYYKAGGTYDADDGRNGRSGKYMIRPDGNLCWTETTGIGGCFQYYRVGKALHLRRTDAGHKFELGPAKVGPL